MSGETLYSIAYEMLNKTNVFRKDVAEIKYTNTMQEEISLLSCVKNKASKYGTKFCNKNEASFQLAYNCIVWAMSVYLESYPAVFSFKQQVKVKFNNWLNLIRIEYKIKDESAAEEIKVTKAEKDTGIAMLKLLHSRKGVTYGELQKDLGITDRAVQKDLVKISPSLYTGPDTPYEPLRLGGQPLLAEISLVDKSERRAEKKRFRTTNTVHPLVLQENIMQLGTLLKALCHRYYNFEDNIAAIIAIDIWSQMSEYARNKIKNYFIINDSDLEDFIFMIDDECPDDHACPFQAEKQMVRDIEMPVEQALEYMMKAMRKGTIILDSGERIPSVYIVPLDLSGENITYQVTNENGKICIISKEQIKDIIINE